jgi:hypothetical protein
MADDFITFDNDDVKEFVFGETLGGFTKYGAIPIEKCMETIRDFLTSMNSGIQWYRIIPSCSASTISNMYAEWTILAWSCIDNPVNDSGELRTDPSFQVLIRTQQEYTHEGIVRDTHEEALGSCKKYYEEDPETELGSDCESI